MGNRMSPARRTARPAGWPRRTVVRLLREPFTRRAWRELGYTIASLPLAIAGFLFTAATLITGTGLTLTIAGIVIGPLLVAASSKGVRGFGAASCGMAGRLLGVRVDVPRPLDVRPGAAGWFWSALNDPVAWRARGYLLLKLPVSVLGIYVVGYYWLGGLAYLTYPLWWQLFHRVSFSAGGVTHPDPVTNPGPVSSIHVLTSPASFLLIPIGAVTFLAAPWLIRAVTALDRTLIRWLLGPPSSERVRDLEQTRAQAVDDSAARLRQIERDLHDGAQAQLVAVTMKLSLAKEKLRRAGADGPGSGQADIDRAFELVDTAHRTAREAMTELRDLARGIHPPILDRGLDAALATLAARSAVPVDLIVDIPQRPSPAIETIAYFCAAELVTNVAKHSGARRATLEVVHVPGLLRVRVSDDGCGGARLVAGSGLAGLADRVRTVDGRLDISSPGSGPTAVTAELPSHA
jgi:signal transduction histidine kinase